MKTYYSVSEVADEFCVSKETVRSWIDKRLLMAVQPAGAGGAYRIPGGALRLFRERSERPPRLTTATPTPRIRNLTPDEFYAEAIEPVVQATGMSADDLVRRMAHDQELMIRYPSFATDYSSHVRAVAKVAAEGARLRTARA